MKALILCLFLLAGCTGDELLNKLELTKGLTSDKKLAIVIKKFQMSTCKETCLTDNYDKIDYTNLDTGETESYYECPLNFREYLCIDLYKDKDGKRGSYKLNPHQWQTGLSHLFGYYSHEQIKKGIEQIEFLCSQDFAICEDNFEALNSIKEYYYERTTKEN